MRVRVENRTAEVVAGMEAATMEAALAMARIIYADSQNEVPVDTGRLKASGRVEEREKEVAVVYGGPGTGVDYALAVHEINRGYRRGKWQYLRDPAMRAKRLLREGAAAMRKHLDSLASRYKTVRAVRDYGPGGGPGSGGDTTR